MARWLWCDCAVLDLMTLVDFACIQVNQAGADDPIVGLIVDLVERVLATESQKSYVSPRLQEAGVGAAVIEQVEVAWRAIRVAPASATTEPHTIADPAPPPPEPRVDEYLAAFAEGDNNSIELARVHIDLMFEGSSLPAALAWWVAVTVDSLPHGRRRSDIEWALVQIATAPRRLGNPMKVVVPPSLLRRWLDTPQLLSASSTKIALDLLGWQQPSVVVQHYLHRAVAASSERHAEILMGGLWRALAATEPAAVLAVASRWLAFGFGQSGFIELLIELLSERAREQPALIEELASTLTPTPDTPANVIEVAREVLDQLRHQSQEGQQP
jgi:hypothetical protein